MSKANFIAFGIIGVISAATGAIVGLGLSWSTSSPLIIGGIIAAISTAVLIALIGYYQENILDREDIPFLSCLCIISVALGANLGKAAGALFPGVMLGMGSAALVGAVIGITAPVAAFLALTCVIGPIAEKASECLPSQRVSDVNEQPLGLVRTNTNATGTASLNV